VYIVCHFRQVNNEQNSSKASWWMSMGSWDSVPDMTVMKCKSSGGHRFQTIHISLKLANKRHILEMSTSPRNDLYRPKLCHLSCTLVTSTHPKYRFWSSFFQACKTPTQKVENFSRVLTSVVSNTVEIGAG